VRLPAVLVVAAASLLTLASSGVISSPAGAGQATATAPSFTAGGSSTAAGDCSKAEALAVVKRLGLGQPEVTNPVYKVLCGAFAGPASKTMVVSLMGAGSAGMLDWVVFGWTGSEWQLLLKRHQAALLSAAGSDIRETVFIFRPGDSRCCPSGGTRSRIWHWNGTSFVAGPWKQVKPPKPSPPPPRQRDGYFKTPSGNIVCYHSPGPVDRPVAFIGCGIKSGLKPAPPRRPCSEGGYAGDRVTMTATGRVKVPACAGDPGALVGAPTARVLGYGKTWSGGGISCRSTFAGLTCRNRSGHGFFLSRARYRTF
jgi:hypothetical protein